jgi:hypothetical protein
MQLLTLPLVSGGKSWVFWVVVVLVVLLWRLHSARPEAGWPGGKVAALHIGLNLWHTAAG